MTFSWSPHLPPCFLLPFFFFYFEDLKLVFWFQRCFYRCLKHIDQVLLIVGTYPLRKGSSVKIGEHIPAPAEKLGNKWEKQQCEFGHSWNAYCISGQICILSNSTRGIPRRHIFSFFDKCLKLKSNKRKWLKSQGCDILRDLIALWLFWAK